MYVNYYARYNYSEISGKDPLVDLDFGVFKGPAP